MKIDQIIHAYNTLTQPRTSHRDGNKAKVSQHFIKSNLGGETLLHCSQTKHTHYSYIISGIKTQGSIGKVLDFAQWHVFAWSKSWGLAPLLVCRCPVLRPRCLGQWSRSAQAAAPDPASLWLVQTRGGGLPLAGGQAPINNQLAGTDTMIHVTREQDTGNGMGRADKKHVSHHPSVSSVQRQRCLNSF